MTTWQAAWLSPSGFAACLELQRQAAKVGAGQDLVRGRRSACSSSAASAALSAPGPSRAPSRRRSTSKSSATLIPLRVAGRHQSRLAVAVADLEEQAVGNQRGQQLAHLVARARRASRPAASVRCRPAAGAKERGDGHGQAQAQKLALGVRQARPAALQLDAAPTGRRGQSWRQRARWSSSA